jgi:UDP-N-acetylmuramate dehydrogenase
VVGNASNLLFDDCGFDGCIICTSKMREIRLTSHPAFTGADRVIYAQCGVLLPTLSRFALHQALTGFEGLCSIPATVGGALCLNAGAYGSEISDKLLAYEIFCPQSNKTSLIFADKSLFSYRKSPLMHSGKAILGAFFLAETGESEQIKAKCERFKALRAENQPQGVKSAGSYFKRPHENEGFPPYQNKSAGQVIDTCGLKGVSVGGAQVSPKHANFLINATGQAQASDVLALARTVKATVYKKTGIRLCEEVEFVPFRKNGYQV